MKLSQNSILYHKFGSLNQSWRDKSMSRERTVGWQTVFGWSQTEEDVKSGKYVQNDDVMNRTIETIFRQICGEKSLEFN